MSYSCLSDLLCCEKYKYSLAATPQTLRGAGREWQVGDVLGVMLVAVEELYPVPYCLTPVLGCRSQSMLRRVSLPLSPAEDRSGARCVVVRPSYDLTRPQ